MKKNNEKSCKEFFGERLKQLRNEKGLSQDALAKALGISKGSLGFYETCKNTPDIVVLNAVSDYFGVSFDYLLGRTEVKSYDIDLKAACEYTGLTEENVEKLHNKKINEENLSLTSFSDISKNRKDALRLTNLMLEILFYSNYVSQLSELGRQKAKHEAFELAALRVICEKEGLPFSVDEIEKHGKLILLLPEFTKRLTTEQSEQIGAIKYYMEKMKFDLPKIGELSLKLDLNYLTYETEKTFSKYLNNIAEEFASELVEFYYQPYMQLLSLPTMEEQVEFAFRFSAQVEGSLEWYTQSTDRIAKLRELLRKEEEKIGKHNKKEE